MKKKKLKLTLPEGAIQANEEKLVSHSTMPQFPLYYEDCEFECIDCGQFEIWTAKQQRWWYEEAKGAIERKAVRCRSCRDLRKKNKDQHQAHMKAMAKIKPHPNEVFFKSIRSESRLKKEHRKRTLWELVKSGLSRF